MQVGVSCLLHTFVPRNVSTGVALMEHESRIFVISTIELARILVKKIFAFDGIDFDAFSLISFSAYLLAC
jgi:hypothetical protein